MADFRQINPTNQVPVLVDGDLTLREGTAIVLHLLEKHGSPTLSGDPKRRAEFHQWLLFANATLHPAYSLLFFGASALENDPAMQEVLAKGAALPSALWAIVEERLQDRSFVCGESLTAVDMILGPELSAGNRTGREDPADDRAGEGAPSFRAGRRTGAGGRYRLTDSYLGEPALALLSPTGSQ